MDLHLFKFNKINKFIKFKKTKINFLINSTNYFNIYYYIHANNSNLIFKNPFNFSFTYRNYSEIKELNLINALEIIYIAIYKENNNLIDKTSNLKINLLNLLRKNEIFSIYSQNLLIASKSSISFSEFSFEDQILILSFGMYLSQSFYFDWKIKAHLRKIFNVSLDKLEILLDKARTDSKQFSVEMDVNNLFNLYKAIDTSNSQDFVSMISKEKLNEYSIKNKKLNSNLIENAKSIVNEWFETHTYEFPNKRSLQELKVITGLKYSQLYSLIHRMLDIKGVIDQEKKNIIINWGKNNDFKFPMKEELKHLSNITGLGNTQIREILRKFREDKPGVVTLDSKLYIREWIKKNERIPNNNERKEILKVIKLNGSQFRNLLHSILQSSGKLTNEKKLFIYNYILTFKLLYSKDIINEYSNINECTVESSKHLKQSESLIRSLINQGYSFELSKDEIESLSKNTNLSEKQIRYIISLLFENRIPFTQDKKEIILNYIKELQRYPLRNERKELERRTGLAPSQIREYLKNIKTSPGILSKETIKIIRNWMNDNENPSKDEKLNLMMKTGLNQKQLNYQIRNFRDDPKKINDSQMELFETWIKSLTSFPSSEEIHNFRRESSLGKKQITYLIKNLNNIKIKTNI